MSMTPCVKKNMMTLTVSCAELSRLLSLCIPWHRKLLDSLDARSKQGALVWDLSRSNFSMRTFRFLASLLAFPTPSLCRMRQECLHVGLVAKQEEAARLESKDANCVLHLAASISSRKPHRCITGGCFRVQLQVRAVLEIGTSFCEALNNHFNAWAFGHSDTPLANRS